MENASKALLMAGGILLTMLVLSLLLYGWNMVVEYQESQDRIKEVEDLAKFNQQFTNYERNDVQGYELLSLVNKVIDYNQRKSEKFNEESAAGNDELYKAITINIVMYKSTSVPDTTITKDEVAKLLTRKVEIPATETINEKIINEENKLTLFIQPKYTQNDTEKQFENNILKDVLEMEKPDSEFGGAAGIQSLVKNIDTIYQGKIIGYNTGNVDTSWYDMNYIVNRYKTLTGKKYAIGQIRDTSKIKNVLKYYEYSYFKKSIFECTKVEYDKDTGRVIQMDFRFTGELM